MNPFISFVMPVWKSEKYIKNTLNCLKTQTDKDFELIICNNNSPDNSMKIINEFKENTSINVVIVDMLKNEGPAYARNKGIDVANGQYIFFYDSDDEISPDFVEEAKKLANRNSVDAIFCGHKFINSKNVTIKEFPIKKRYEDKWHFSQTWHIILKCQLVKESAIRFPENNTYPEDFPFFIAHLPLVNSYAFMRKCMYGYRIHDESLCNAGKKLPIPTHEQFNIVMGYFKRALDSSTHDDRVKCERRALKAYYWILLMWLPTVSAGEGIEYYIQYKKNMDKLFLGYLKNKSNYFMFPKYETIKTNIVVNACFWLEKMKLFTFFLKIYMRK